MNKKILTLIFASTLVITSCKKTKTIKTEEKVEVSPTGVNEIYKVSKENSIVNWEGTKLNNSKHFGTLKLSEGKIGTTDNKITRGYFIIDMNSLTVDDIKDEEKNAMLTEHLKGSNEKNMDHFFNVEKYPSARFQIVSVTPKENKYIVKGNLTIKDVEKSIEFPAFIDIKENEVTFNADEFTFDRTEFGIKFKSGKFFDDLGDKAIHDAVKIKFSVKANK